MGQTSGVSAKQDNDFKTLGPDTTQFANDCSVLHTLAPSEITGGLKLGRDAAVSCQCTLIGSGISFNCQISVRMPEERIFL